MSGSDVVLRTPEAIAAAKAIAEANARKKEKEVVSLTSLLSSGCPLESCNICLDPEAFCGDACVAVKKETREQRVPLALSCGHSLCRGCWDAVETARNAKKPKPAPQCPLCRKEVSGVVPSNVTLAKQCGEVYTYNRLLRKAATAAGLNISKIPPTAEGGGAGAGAAAGAGAGATANGGTAVVLAAGAADAPIDGAGILRMDALQRELEAVKRELEEEKASSQRLRGYVTSATSAAEAAENAAASLRAKAENEAVKAMGVETRLKAADRAKEAAEKKAESALQELQRLKAEQDGRMAALRQEAEMRLQQLQMQAQAEAMALRQQLGTQIAATSQLQASLLMRAGTAADHTEVQVLRQDKETLERKLAALQKAKTDAEAAAQAAIAAAEEMSREKEEAVLKLKREIRDLKAAIEGATPSSTAAASRSFAAPAPAPAPASAPAPAPAVKPPPTNVNAEHLDLLVSMGFARGKVITALQANKNDLEASMNALLSNPSSSSSPSQPPTPPPEPAAAAAAAPSPAPASASAASTASAAAAAAAKFNPKAAAWVPPSSSPSASASASAGSSSSSSSSSISASELERRRGIYGDLLTGRASLRYGSYPETTRQIVGALLSDMSDEQLHKASMNPVFLDNEIQAAFAKIWASSPKGGSGSGSAAQHQQQQPPHQQQQQHSAYGGGWGRR